MSNLGEQAMEILDELHTERLSYESEYVPLADAANLLAEYERTGMDPEAIERMQDAFGRGLTLRTDARERLEIIKGLSTDRLRELVAEAESRKFDPGREVWVVEREDDEAVEVSGYVFVAQAGSAAIVSPYIGMSGDIEYILSEQIEQTAEGLSGDLQVYPISDCYQTKQAAEAALKGEQDATKV